jgi:O-acetyl-ADP-ribose deacetylase (regulator of RNase III)
MKKINGNIVGLAYTGQFDVIIHGCNCFCTMGAGFAKAIKLAFPEAYEADLRTVCGDIRKLGGYSYANIKRVDLELTIVNAYTQHGYGRTKRHVDYNAVDSVFSLISQNFKGKRILYPMIGAGLGGGDWNIIREIICRHLDGEDHTLLTYSDKDA